MKKNKKIFLKKEKNILNNIRTKQYFTTIFSQ